MSETTTGIPSLPDLTHANELIQFGDRSLSNLLAIAAGIFFACLLTLTYLSRSLDAKLVWSIISILLLGLVWGLGRNRRQSFAAIACTISGLITPVLGLLVPYRGLTLSLAGLLSVTWLIVQNWRDRLR
jgi:hypothetical protein